MIEMVDTDFEIMIPGLPEAEQCIWADCEEKPLFVLKCKLAFVTDSGSEPITMEVCVEHAKKLLKTRVVTGRDGNIDGLSTSGEIGGSSEDDLSN